MNNKTLLSSILVLILAVILISSCASPATPEPEITATPPSPTQTVSPTESPPTESPPTETSADESAAEASGIDSLAEIVLTRTPEPTATPDALTEAVEEIAQETGLAGKTLLGLSFEDWFNLGFSLLIVLAAYLIGTWAIHWLFPRLVSRTKTDLDDRLLQVSGDELRWLVVVLILRFATDRLGFIGTDLKTTLADIYFLLILFLVIVILWRLINLAASEAAARAKKDGRQKQAESLITLMVWGLRFLVFILAISVSLTHYGVDITGFAVFLGIIGLAISLAGRDVLADIISGAMILIDQPYRIGDRVEMLSLDTWGDIVEIGMRSTKVLLIDNRMVIVPNSQIAQNQIVNYSIPDPAYNDISAIGVAYENDVDQVGQLLMDTIRSVEGVESEREIDAWLLEFTQDQMIFKYTWWIQSYQDLLPTRNRVNRAVIQALKGAGVVLPYRKTQFNIGSNTESYGHLTGNDDGDTQA